MGKTLTSLNIAQTVRGYRFFIDRVGLENAMSYIQQPCIVVVLGGNTFRLNNALYKVPDFRAKLIERIKNGKVMYVSYSAGTIIAGTRLHKFGDTSDDPAAVGDETVNMEGLGIYHEGQINPHGNSRPGTKLEDGQALFVCGSSCGIDEVAPIRRQDFVGLLDLNGHWTIRWVSGQTAKIVVRNDE